MSEGDPGRMPPSDIPAEQCVLGSVLMAPQVLGDVVAALRTSDFVRGAHQTVFDCMKALSSRGEAIDHLTVRNEIERIGGLGRIGGDPIYLHTLLQSVPTVAHLPEYVERVRRCGILRRGAEVGTRMVARAYDGDDDVDAYIAEFDAEVRHLAMYNDTRIESLSTVDDFCSERPTRTGG
jgi:replicative DNA helicase